MTAQWQITKCISKRFYITGDLCMKTPSHLGCGDSEGVLDMPLLRDPLEGKALLTGATLAGALRAYLIKNGKDEEASRLFGDVNNKISYESPLIVEDAIGSEPQIEVRDGVAINPETRTAFDQKKYDYELMLSGMVFPISFELILSENMEIPKMIEAMAFALKGLQDGEIFLGKRKSRGFGECHVTNWKCWTFDWNTQGMLDWLSFNVVKTEPTFVGNNIEKGLRVNLEASMESSKRCKIEATFTLDSSLLIRSSSMDQDLKKVNSIYMHNNQGDPIISGTSLAGLFRGRVFRIANTLGKDGQEVVNRMFGSGGKKDSDGHEHRAQASRFWVKETTIVDKCNLDYVHTRVGIDRFTGGASNSRLFSEIPAWAADQTTVTLTYGMDKPDSDEVIYLLLLLKDLWLGDLPIGGESSIGRGRLNGKEATIEIGQIKWIIKCNGDDLLTLESENDLEFQKWLKDHFKGSKND